MELLDYLYLNEFLYVDEIHRIAEGHFFSRELNGWFYMPACVGSGDWSIARLIGSLDIGLELLSLVPDANTVFIVPHGLGDKVNGFIKENTLHYYLSEDSLELPELMIPYRLEFKKLHVFLLYNEQVIGYIKPIRESKNAYEIYIEIIPSFRGKDLAIYLMSYAVENYHKLGKKLLYVVEENNKPSLNLVKKALFQKITTLDTFRSNI